MDALRVLRENESRLMQFPNVTGVGVGEKNGRDVIRVFVTQKLPESALGPAEIIPKTLEGVETEVVESGAITAQHP